MTIEELNERNNDPKVMELKRMISDESMDKHYVFVSYKSDDWKIVLTDILYKLVTEYGLNFYFDGSFDLHNSSWIKQFPKNMNTYKCVGVLAFLNDRYATSYATLMELMHSQTFDAGGEAGMPIIPVNLEDLNDVTGEFGDSDTGLGKKSFSNGSTNLNAQEEKKLFDKDYQKIIKKSFIKDEFEIYDPEDDVILNRRKCSTMVRELLASKGYNTNIYSNNESFYRNLVATIKNTCGSEVFSEVKREENKQVEEVPAENKQVENKPAEKKPKSAQFYEGTWNGKEVIFKRVWSEHPFTDDECERLCNGEEIEIVAFSPSERRSFICKGALGKREVDGVICFLCNWKTKKWLGEVPDKWCQHEFTDDEKYMLKTGQAFYRDDFVSSRTGEPFPATVHLGKNEKGDTKIVPVFPNKQ